MSSGITVRGESYHWLALRFAVLLNGGLFLALLCVWLKMAALGVFWRADFTAFHAGWSMVLDGQGSRLYDRDLQTVYYQRSLADPDLYEGLLPFNHPPHSALLFSPLALLPCSTAFYLWTIVQIGLIALAWRFLQELTLHWDTQTTQILLVTFLAFPALFLTFQHGQIALVSLVCLLGFVRGLKKDRSWEMAIWLVLGSIKPQMVVIPALLLLATRRWRALGIATGMFALWSGATTLVFGPECWWRYLEAMRYTAEQFGTAGVNPLRMYNLKSLLTAMLGIDRTGLVNAMSFASLLLAGGLVLLMWRGPWRPDASDFDLRLAFTLMLSLICNPHCNGHDVLPLVVPVVLFVNNRFHAGIEPFSRDAESSERSATASALRSEGTAPKFLVEGEPASAGFGGSEDSASRLNFAEVVVILAPLLMLIDVYAFEVWPGGVRPFLVVMMGLAGWTAWLLAEGSVESIDVPGSEQGA